jgi:hypothetical protein
VAGRGAAGAEVAWAPHPGPQTLLVTCPVGDVLYGGARGGGKSAGLLMDFCGHAARYGAAARGILIRRSYPEFDELIRQAQQFLAPLGWTWTAAGSEPRTWTAPNGATLRLRYLESDTDAANYQGHSYTWVGIDEAGNFPSAKPIDLLRATLNRVRDIPGHLRLTGNPGGVGHSWLKARYITPARPGQVFVSELGTEAVFIPSSIEDNPSLGLEYEATIKAATFGNDALWKAWRYGDWDAIAGAAFSEWDATKHVIPARAHKLPQDETFIGLDWGYAKGGAVLCHGTPNRMEVADSVALVRMTAREAGGYLAQRWRAEVPAWLAYSPDMDVETGVGVTLAREFAAGWKAVAGEEPPMLAGVQKPGSRRAKKVLVHQALQVPPSGVPYLRLWDTATYLRETLPTLPIAKHDPNDIDTEADDHGYDALGFVLAVRQPPVHAPMATARFDGDRFPAGARLHPARMNEQVSPLAPKKPLGGTKRERRITNADGL